MNGLEKVSDDRLKEIAASDVTFDDDIPEFTDEQLRQFTLVNPQYFKVVPKKKAISIKIDVDVLEELKKGGPGYQTRINSILRKAVFQ
ncbi:MAG: BrnA antitoxin family protein [Spirochaetales bacterium]|nr:BrnA antitoxin family protein [Spirochaetales bacterium]